MQDKEAGLRWPNGNPILLLEVDYGVETGVCAAERNRGQNSNSIELEILVRGPGSSNAKFQRSYCTAAATPMPDSSIHSARPEKSCKFPPPNKLGLVTIRR